MVISNWEISLLYTAKGVKTHTIKYIFIIAKIEISLYAFYKCVNLKKYERGGEIGLKIFKIKKW